MFHFSGAGPPLANNGKVILDLAGFGVEILRKFILDIICGLLTEGEVYSLFKGLKVNLIQIFY